MPIIMNASSASQDQQQTRKLFEVKRQLIDHKLHGKSLKQRNEDAIRPRLAGAVVPISTKQHRIWVHAESNPVWNDTDREYPNLTLHELIEAQANRTPDKIAATEGNTSWTYRELLIRANAVCNNLRELDVKPGAIVAVVLHHSLDMLAGVLGILKAGAAYLPLDPCTPASRRKLRLEDANPAAILTETTITDLPIDIAPLLYVDALDELSNPRPMRMIAADDLAYVIYRSSTTRDPKGVEIPHSEMVRLLTSMQAESGLSARDHLLAVTTISFDIAALELFLPLISGGTVIVASREVVQAPRLHGNEYENSKCTAMQRLRPQGLCCFRRAVRHHRAK